MANFIKSVRYGSVCNCSALVNVTIPSQLTTMRDYAFQRCAIKNYNSSNAKNFSELAFFECYDFQKIEVASGHPSYSTSNGVLFNKNKTKLILYPVGK
ncbi:MAG: leucine-rich repeat protein [Anaerostipes hadrus]